LLPIAINQEKHSWNWNILHDDIVILRHNNIVSIVHVSMKCEYFNKIDFGMNGLILISEGWLVLNQNFIW